MGVENWLGIGSELGKYVSSESQKSLKAYLAKPDLVLRDANIEQSVSQSGYGRKQLNELIQNAADALRGVGGKIAVVLTSTSLYCANEGAPLSKNGCRTLLLSHTSLKRDDEIGRFGLGFKSVLQVTRQPEIFSRSGSVSWSSAHSKQLLESIHPGLENYPQLTIAKPIDPVAAANEDKILAELMSWASTVVRLPLLENVHWLQQEIQEFPHHFLLFSPHVDELCLDDRVSGKSVSWTSVQHDSHVELSDGTTKEDWLLLQYKHRVSPAAAADAGSIFAREQVDVAWAVPIGPLSRRDLGTIWNYFPTEHRLSLRGIVNAAFKMNDDRVNMLESLYNREILEKAVPTMVAGALAKLSTVNDPAAHFDVLPSREKENRGWPDKTLNRPVMQAVVSVPFLPDMQGELQPIASMNVQPDLSDHPNLVNVWDSVAGRSPNWVHASAFLNKERSSLVTRTLELAQRKRASVTEWLEAVVQDPGLPNFEAALQLAAYIDKRLPEYMEEMRRSRILLMADGRVISPLRNRAELPSHPEDTGDDLVDYEMMHYGDSLASLRALGFEVFNGSGRLKKVARDVADNYDNKQHAESLWRLSRTFRIDEATEIFSEYLSIDKVLVLRKDGVWKPLGSAWLPGPLLRADRPEDAPVIVDPLFHGKDLEIFRQLGMRSTLPEALMQQHGSTYEKWKLSEATRLSEESLHSPQPVSNKSIKFGRILLTPRLDELIAVSAQTRADITKQLLARDFRVSAKVEFTAEFKSPIHLEGPDLWWIRTYGALNTPLGTVDVKYCVGSIQDYPESFLPTAVDETAAQLSLPTESSGVSWSFVLPLAEEKLSLNQTHQLYGLMAAHGVSSPKQLLVQSAQGNTTRYPAKMVSVAADAETHGYLSANLHHASIFTGHEQLDDSLASSWGLKSKKVVFTEALRIVESTVDDSQLSEDLFPELKAVTSIKPVLCVPCNSIELVRSNDLDSDETSVPFKLYRDKENNKVYYRNDLTLRLMLVELLSTYKVRIDAREVETLRKERLKERKQREIEKKVRGTKDPAVKLALLVGADALQSLIPEAVRSMLTSRGIEMTDQLRFNIVNNLYGANLMEQLQPALNAAGIKNPEDFKGRSKQAKEFLKDLGFSRDLIAQDLPRKPDREEIVGPVRLKELHGYQRSTAQKIKALLNRESENLKGVVQLPTGAGKTRVAAQSVIEHLAETPGPQVVVWIAHSEELCEQAIESWTTVWQAVGPSGERMAISRLWGGRPAKHETTKLHFVVTTIQTLTRIADDVAARAPRGVQYAWLGNPDVVIIDEAHGAIAASYTPVLKWFKRSTRDTKRPLLGLSATPYRGTNELETARLVNRFEANLIEPDEFTVETAHEYLQNMGVLAKVRHEMLEGIKLQQRHDQSTKPTDDDSKNAMLEQRVDLDLVARSSERNNKIISHLVHNNDQIKHALVFAASVEHADALAAVLTASGVPSASISSKTPSSQRRALIEKFRAGDIQVLTNFDILSQGFDAPKIDAVYMCRPTFSPNKYIQMVGRGLRGKANGGSEEVLIVNIKDNLELFGTQLAYTEFDYLWNREIAHA